MAAIQNKNLLLHTPGTVYIKHNKGIIDIFPGIFELMQHSHLPFLKMAAISINVPISYDTSPRVMIMATMHRKVNSGVKFVKHFMFDFGESSQPLFYKMAAVKLNCLDIKKKKFWRDLEMDTFVKIFICIVT